MKEVGAWAFYGCKQLKNVRLNEGLEKLGEKVVIGGNQCEGGVFVGCAMESIVTPSTLKRIEANTFSGCRNLKNIDIQNGVEYIG